MAKFPEVLPTNEEFEVDIMIYYNIWCAYNTAGVREFTMIGIVRDDHSSTGANEEDSSKVVQVVKTLKFRAKIFGNGSQR